MAVVGYARVSTEDQSTEGLRMEWVLRPVETEVTGSSRSHDVLEIDRPGGLGELEELGLALVNGKQHLAQVQHAVVAAQSWDHGAQRPTCRSCAASCQVKDYRPYRMPTSFGAITLRLPRFRCIGCGGVENSVKWPGHC
jgi:hypothetical protein